MKENWEPVLDGRYHVSDLGRVRRALGGSPRARPGTILVQRPDKDGYLRLTIPRSGKRRTTGVHRLVCEAFQGPAPSPKHQVAHGDGNRANNCAWNLRWALPSENQSDKERHGTVFRGSKSPLARLSEATVLNIRRRYRNGESQQRIAAAVGVSQAHISRILLRQSWAHLTEDV